MAIPTSKLYKLFDGHQGEAQSSSITEAPRRASKTSRVSVVSSGSQEPKIRRADGPMDNRSMSAPRTQSRPRMNPQMSVSFGGHHRPVKSSDNMGASTAQNGGHGSRGLPRRISSLFSSVEENNGSRPSSPVTGQKELLHAYLERRVEQMEKEAFEAFNTFSDPDMEDVMIPTWGEEEMMSVAVPDVDADEPDLASRPTTVRIKETPRYHEPPRQRRADSNESPASSYDDDVDDRWEDDDRNNPNVSNNSSLNPRPSLGKARSMGYRSAGGRSQTSSALSRQMSSIPAEAINSVFDSQARERMEDLYMDTFLKQLKELKLHATQEATTMFKKPLEDLQQQWSDATARLQNKEKETDELKREIEKLREDKEQMERRILDSVRLESQSREKVVKERQAHIATRQEMEANKMELEKLRMQFGLQEKKMRHSMHFGEFKKSLQSRPQSTRASQRGAFSTFRAAMSPPTATDGQPIEIDVPNHSAAATGIMSPQTLALRQSQSLPVRKSEPEQKLEEGIRRLRAKLKLARVNAEHVTEPAKPKEREQAQRNVQFVKQGDRPLLWSGARKGPTMSRKLVPSRSDGIGIEAEDIAERPVRQKSKSLFVGTPTRNWRAMLAQQQGQRTTPNGRVFADTPKSTTATIGTDTPASKPRHPLMVNGHSVRTFGDAIPTPVEQKMREELTRVEQENTDLKRRISQLEMRLSGAGATVHDEDVKVAEQVAPLPDPDLVLPPANIRFHQLAEERRMSKAALELPPKRQAQPHRSMRRLDWKPLVSVSLQETVWMQLNDSDIFLDERDIEANFGERRRRRRKNSEVPEYKTLEDDSLVHFIPEKRRHFVHESLRRFRLSPDEVRQALITMDPTMTADSLIKLLDIIPTLDEQNRARMYFQQPREALGFAEYFFAKLSDVHFLRFRIQLWLFKLQFQEIIGQYRDEISVLKDALMSIKDSRSLPLFLKVALAIGNYINSNSPKGGAYGFDLTSLNVFDKFKSNDGRMTFLMYLVQYCDKHYPDALNVVGELRSTHDASKATTHTIAQNVMDVNGELTKLGSALRKFKKHPIELGDRFVPVMKTFHKEALKECKAALDDWYHVRELAMDIGRMFHLHAETVEEVCGIFDSFVSAIRRARDGLEKTKRVKHLKEQNRAKMRKAQEVVQERLSMRPQPAQLHAKNIVTHESTHKQREEVKRELSRLVYERSKLLEFQQSQGDGEMTVQRLRYLRDLIKSHETPTNIKNPFHMAQKQRRRRRSLTADEIGIGLGLPEEIREDDEVR